MYHHPRSMFGPIQHIRHQDQIRPHHTTTLDAYRRAHGLPPWLKRTDTMTRWPTVPEINAAVDWWNDWQNHTPESP